MNTVPVLKEIKFVIATVTSPTMYLYKTPGEYKYRFYKRINKALYTKDREVAKMLLDEYKQITNDNIDLVVIPVCIEYALVDES